MFGVFVCIDRFRFDPPDRHDKILLQAFAHREPDRLPLRHGRPARHEKRLRIDQTNLNLDSVEARFDTTRYLTPYSDVAALMVLEHQTHMTNLLIRTAWEFRVATHEGRTTGGVFAAVPRARADPVLTSAVRALVDYMLFIDEAPLMDAIVGSAGFETVFARRGPFDRQGRSLREIDLTERLFRYPCSYMIYTAAFTALP